MAFKIKDGVRIGTVDVFNNSADLLAPNVVGTATVQAAATQDAVKIAGRAGGTNSRSVTLTPTTLTDSRTLTLPDRTDTVATLLDTYAFKTITVSDSPTGTFGATGSAVADATGDTVTFYSGDGIDVDVDATNTAIRIAHADTSSEPTSTNSGTIFIQSITLDEFGHITDIVTGDASVAEADTLQTVTERGQDGNGRSTTDELVSFLNATESNSATTGAVIVSGGVGIAKNLNVGGSLIVTGDLTVEGNTTTINTATLDVEDLNITVAKNATNNAEANGAGLTVAGSNATLLYSNADDSWNFNKLLNLTSLNVADNTTLGSNGTDTITVNSVFVNGTQLKTTTTDANTFALSAYDVDNTTYRDLITLTASNTPTLTLTSTGTGSINNMTIGASTAAAGTFTALTVNDNTTLGADGTDTITVNAVFVDGTQLKTTTTSTDTLALSAYDVDGTAYVDLITLTASNTPTLAITSTGVGTINNMSIGATTASTGAFTTLSASGSVTLNGAGATLSLQPSGAGTVTINPATAGTINNMSIGASTPAAGTFTALTVNDNTTLGANGTDTITVNSVFVTGTQLKTNTTSGNTLHVSAYDVDGTAYVNLITATAANEPTLNLTSTGVGTINNMSIGATTPSSGAFTTLSASGSFSVSGTDNATSQITGALQVDGGVSVDKDIYLSGNIVYATSSGTKVGEERAIQTSVSSTSATPIDTWAIATYRYARYIVQITQGTDIQISEVRMTHDGTTTYITEYAVLETSTPLAAAFTGDINSGNARLIVTMGSATAATINIIRTLVVV